MTKPRCNSCGEIREDIEERYSYGVYAGTFCTQCCYKYRDNCGIDQSQGNPSDLEAIGETYWEEE